MIKLKLGIQNYNWGKKGLESEVSKYLVSSGQVSPDEIDKEEHFAELWLGTHSKTPNYIDEKFSLKDFVEENTELLGHRIVNDFGTTLPFLLKVLSIGHPLQLQIHPTKTEAKELHDKSPHAFLDENHKPEMAVALTPFTALCGFRTPEEILNIADQLKEFALVIGSEAVDILKDNTIEEERKIRKCYEAIFQSNKTSEVFQKIQTRLKSKFVEDFNLRKAFGDEFLTIFESFPGDPGCFAPFLLNVYRLDPGEAIFVPAGEIHAYISGDCIEVLSCGDNVLFCGLVHEDDIKHFPPELTDPTILAEIVNFKPNSSARVLLTTDEEGNNVLAPPVEEFNLTIIRLIPFKEVFLSCKDNARTLFVLKGGGSAEASDGGKFDDMTQGQGFFLAAGQGLKLQGGVGGLEVYITSLGSL